MGLEPTTFSLGMSQESDSARFPPFRDNNLTVSEAYLGVPAVTRKWSALVCISVNLAAAFGLAELPNTPPPATTKTCVGTRAAPGSARPVDRLVDALFLRRVATRSAMSMLCPWAGISGWFVFWVSERRSILPAGARRRASRTKPSAVRNQARHPGRSRLMRRSRTSPNLPSHLLRRR